MTSRMTLVLAIAGVALACTQERAVPDKSPPVASYAADTHHVKIGETVVSVPGATVTPEFFRSAATLPFLGRLLLDADFAASAELVVVLSHELWVGRFASATSVIGRSIEIDERPTIVVGVMSPGFKHPEGAQLWVPKGGR